MKLFQAFSEKAPNKVFFSILAGAFAGICYSGLIPLVLTSIGSYDDSSADLESGMATVFSIEIAQYKIAIVFLVVCLLILFTRTLSEVVLIRVATFVSKDFRVKFYDQIAAAPISAIESIGSSKLIASINTDVPRVVMGARVFPGLLINGVTLFGMLGFLSYLNFEVFKLVLSAIIFGIIAYQVPMYFSRIIFTRSRKFRDDLQEAIRALVYGSKELKVNEIKRKVFFSEILLKHEDDILRTEKNGQTIVYATTGFGELLSFFVIGLVSFVFLNYHAITKEELVGVIMALLYVTGPVGVVLNSIPQLMVALVSLNKVNEILAEIPVENISRVPIEIENWDTIRFTDVSYQYDSRGDESGFVVGPLDFELKKGVVTFIVGANGSGKSTLSKLITMHYQHQQGSIKFGDCELTSDSIFTLRQDICAIYSDYFLFDRLLGDITDDLLRTAQKYLEEFQLAEKVTIVDGQFSTLSLSDGQKKRLALLISFLEDKELYLFDEWAADQDPVFKKIFYTKILTELKEKGKAIVVISHDDRYFPYADEILEMEQGKLIVHKGTQPLLANASISSF